MTIVMPAHPFRRSEWICLALLFVVAFGTRAEMLNSDYFSDEPMSFALSRHVFTPPEQVRDIDGVGTWHYPRSWYLERPGFYLLLTPAGLISFTAYRMEYILIAALLAPLGARLLRSYDVRPAFAYAAGLGVAIHPDFVQWGAITHMDTPMTVALAGGFLANRLGHHRWAAFLFMWAVWTKQTAMPFLLFVLFIELAIDAARTRRLPWPIRFDPRTSALFTGILLGFIPFLLAQEMGFGLPGEHASGRSDFIIDISFLNLWLLPLIIANLGLRRTREFSIWAFGLPIFYLALHNLFDWNVREWYVIASAFFSVLATAACLDGVWDLARLRAPHWRAAPVAASVLVVLLFTGLVFEDDSAKKQEYAHPLVEWHSPSLQQKLMQQQVRDLNNRFMLAAIEATGAQKMLLVDVHYAYAFHPLPDFVEHLRVTHTGEFHGNPDVVRAVIDVAEEFADLTVLEKRPGVINEQFRRTYDDCKVEEGETYVFFDIRDCKGRFEEFYQAIAGPVGGP